MDYGSLVIQAMMGGYAKYNIAYRRLVKWCARSDSNRHCTELNTVASYRLGYARFWFPLKVSNLNLLTQNQPCYHYTKRELVAQGRIELLRHPPHIFQSQRIYSPPWGTLASLVLGAGLEPALDALSTH